MGVSTDRFGKKRRGLRPSDRRHFERFCLRCGTNLADPLNAGDYLREQYEKGLEEGGVAEAALCRGVLMAGEDMGIDDSWLPREDKHREALDRAWRLHYIGNSISTSAPSIPKALQAPRTLSRRPERNRASGPAFLVSPGSQIAKQEDTSATAPQKRALQKDAAAKRKKRWK